MSPDLADEYAAVFGVAGAVNHADPVFLAGFGAGQAATGYHGRCATIRRSVA